MLPEKYRYFEAEFPLEYAMTGVAAGNGYLGLLCWGDSEKINLTIGCSALWDNRGGDDWHPEQTYSTVIRLLKAQDAEGMSKLFPRPEMQPATIPLARVVIPFRNAEYVKLDILTGILTVTGADNAVEIILSQKDKGVFCVKGASCTLVPSWDLSGTLQSRGFAEPSREDCGFVQPMPANEPFGIRYAVRDDVTVFRMFREDNSPVFPEYAVLKAEVCAFWKAFWEKVPVLDTGDPEINAFYYRGLFNFQGMTAADGFPAGLQGPWIEDTQIPPWSSDYHFNINVQMYYWPACRAGLFDNLKPLWKMMESWREVMRRNAEYFVGIKDGFVLPHSVDSRCTNLAGYWTGTIDQTCAGWMAIMMFEYYRYSGDLDFLERFGFEFMYGTMRVYEKMLNFDGEHYELPIAASPEYRSSEINACGRNPSFHLAAIHRLLRDLKAACRILGKDFPAQWDDIQEKLPWYSECEGEIALWDGLLLEESHRHHSHLAGICPFDSGNIPEDVVGKSRHRWIRLGMGLWAGWSMPWAVMLHNRFGHAEMANILCKIWPLIYTNQGGRTLHDPQIQGFALGLAGSNRIMQMDAGLGMVAAILDLFAYESQGILEIFHGIPETRKHFSCENLVLPDGFRFTGNEQKLHFTSLRGGTLSFRFPASGKVWTDEDGKCYDGGTVLRLEMNKNETKTFILTR